MQRRKKNGYFKPIPDAPKPLSIQVKKLVQFSEVDSLGIVWHGRYPVYFEEAAAALGRACGLSYKDYLDANIGAPIVQFHIDYHQSLRLEDEFVVKASLIWCEGAKLNTEFMIVKKDGIITTTGYSVQMFIDSSTNEFCLYPPELLERCKRRWLSGELKCLQ